MCKILLHLCTTKKRLNPIHNFFHQMTFMNNPHQEVFNDFALESSGTHGTSSPASHSEDGFELIPAAAFVRSAATASAESTGNESGAESQPVDAYFASFDEPQLENVIGADDRVRINPTTGFPWRAICALRIRSSNGNYYVGTGWLISPRTVITAGHCVYMHNDGGWAESIEVIPALNDTTRPYGSGKSSVFRSTSGWTRDKNRDFDYAAIILPAAYRPGDTVGFFGYATRNDASLMSKTLNLSGYPADKGAKTQWFHARATQAVAERTITYDIDTFGGQSGAPVWFLENGNRYAVGIHTNGHNSGNSATRIIAEVYNNLTTWKNLGL